MDVEDTILSVICNLINLCPSRSNLGLTMVEKIKASVNLPMYSNRVLVHS